MMMMMMILSHDGCFMTLSNWPSWKWWQLFPLCYLVCWVLRTVLLKRSGRENYFRTLRRLLTSWIFIISDRVVRFLLHSFPFRFRFLIFSFSREWLKPLPPPLEGNNENRREKESNWCEALSQNSLLLNCSAREVYVAAFDFPCCSLFLVHLFLSFLPSPPKHFVDQEVVFDRHDMSVCLKGYFLLSLFETSCVLHDFLLLPIRKERIRIYETSEHPNIARLQQTTDISDVRRKSRFALLDRLED